MLSNIPHIKYKKLADIDNEKNVQSDSMVMVIKVSKVILYSPTSIWTNS